MSTPEGYRGLIAEKLTEGHYQQFRDRGFNDIEIPLMIQDGLRSVTAAEAVDLGYVSKQGRAYLGCGGWVYTTRSGFVQFRPDDLEKFAKYLNPTRHRAAIALPPDAEWVTEGVIDAYFCRFRGRTSMGIVAGVSHYKAAPKDSGLNWLFDHDGWVNPSVFTNLVHAALHTGGKVQIIPGKGKDGAQEYFQAGHTAEDFQKLLAAAYSPAQLLFELPKHWDDLPETKLIECTYALVRLAVAVLNRTQQQMLWVSLGKASKLGKKPIETMAAAEYLKTEEGQKQREEDETNKCPFLQNKRDIEQEVSMDLRLNQLRQCLEYQGQEINPGRYKTFVAEQINREVSREDAVEILGAIAEKNAYHPVQDYLERVYQQYGDSTVHLLDDAAFRFLNPKYRLLIYNTYLRRWMIGAVARIFEPGCQFDYVLILQGKEGQFKSTFFRTLAGDEFFDENLGDLGSIKDELLILHMAWIHEWAEFDRVSNKREASLLKAFITRREDRFRAPYDRAVVPHKRRSVLCGTVNETSFLLEGENRRFWPIPIAAAVDIETVRAERDRLWAAAVALYRSGELPTLDPDETATNIALNQEYQPEDTWEDLINRFLSDGQHLYAALNSQDRSYFLLREVLEHGLNLKAEQWDSRAEKRASRVLKRLGCEPCSKKRLEGLGLVRAWRIPPAAAPTEPSGTEAEQTYTARVSGHSKDSTEDKRNRSGTSSSSKAFSDSVPLDPLLHRSTGEKEIFSGNGTGPHSSEKNGSSQGSIGETSGTAEQNFCDSGISRVSSRTAKRSASVPLEGSGTSGTVAVGDAVRVTSRTQTDARYKGTVEAIDGDRASIRYKDGAVENVGLAYLLKDKRKGNGKT